ncbi:MAG: HAMP domain-containing sensor histidine kinase [Bacteroidota bacterium]
MPNTMQRMVNSLYWRISAVLLLLLMVIGLVYIYITTYSAKMYFQEASQRLNAGIAEHIVQEVPTFTETGAVNNKALEEMFHHVMTLHPAIEIYLLNPQGKILSYFAPHKKIKLRYVSLKPIQHFIQSKGIGYVVGDDPRHPPIQKVFSAAMIRKDKTLQGYMYVVLASEELDSVSDVLMGTYLMRVGTYAMGVTLTAAFLIGLLSIWVLTKNLRKITEAVRRFKEGDRQSRIEGSMNGEFALLSHTFNTMADTLVRNMDELQSLERLRSELVANISHDLRTPIAIVHGYIETLIIKADTLSPSEREKYLETVLKSTEKLKQLVQDLFEFSKFEAMQVVPQVEAFSLTELVNDTVLKYQLLAQTKKISIHPAFAKNLPMVFADIAMIDRVLQNLIDNAIKFTPEGGSITVELIRKTEGVEVKVSDTGMGISDQELPFIFDRYYTTNLSATSESTGLGLAIVKKILDLNKITIDVKSQLNWGTSFVFQLPVYVSPALV